VNNTNGEYITAFDVGADGKPGNPRNFAKYPTVTRTPAGQPNSGADGLAVDAEGRVYCAALGGVQVFSPKGEHLGTIPVSLQPQNIAFAGADKKTLYIVGRGAAFKVRLLTAGFGGRGK
jgi:gluconolactonase